jgi:hypothetical protein
MNTTLDIYLRKYQQQQIHRPQQLLQQHQQTHQWYHHQQQRQLDYIMILPCHPNVTEETKIETDKTEEQGENTLKMDVN